MQSNFLEDQLLKKTLFSHEELLEINYVPDIILHRDQELLLLSKIFVKLLENPYLISRKVLIQGEIGLGKTVLAQIFGKMLLSSAEKRKINIKSIHINCRKDLTSYKVLSHILHDLNCFVPQRGYSPQELISIFQDFLEKNNIYLLLTLDELNYLDSSKFDLIYSLSRLNDSKCNSLNYISLIAIVRDVSLLRYLDESTISSLQGNIITVKKYSKKQIIDIFNYRISQSLKSGIFPEDLVEVIADYLLECGDIRKGLNIICNAVKIAESSEKTIVEIDDVNKAMTNLIPSIQIDALDCLTFQQLILLYSIADYLFENNKKIMNIYEIKHQYEKACIRFNEKSRANTQLWESLQNLKNNNIIKIKTVSKNIKGRLSSISINDIPISILIEELNIKLKNFEKSDN